jgi:hypothetical protein
MEPSQTQPEGGTYVYAVTAAGPSPEVLTRVSGIHDGKVYTVATDDLAAVVSDVGSREELRPERKNLAAHQRVLGQVTEACSVVLPFAFGTIAESADDVRSLLQRNHDDLAAQLQRVEGMVEMVVRIWFSAQQPSMFEYFVGQNPELEELRSRIAGGEREPTREEKIELGERFAAVLEDTRQDYEQELVDALIPHCREVKHLDPRTDEELTRVACLVGKPDVAELEAAVHDVAEHFPDLCSIEVTGPFPPYDFIDLRLHAWSPQ